MESKWIFSNVKRNPKSTDSVVFPLKGIHPLLNKQFPTLTCKDVSSSMFILTLSFVRNRSLYTGCANVGEKITLQMDLEIFFTLDNLYFQSVTCGKCTLIRSNSICASVHTLSPISTHDSCQTVNGPVSISKSIIEPEFSGQGMLTNPNRCNNKCKNNMIIIWSLAECLALL